MKAIFVAFAIFAVYLYVASSQKVDCPTDFEDDKDYVLTRDPCNCSAYIVCVPGAQFNMPCPVGLHYNAAKKICDYPNKAHCKVDAGCPPRKASESSNY